MERRVRQRESLLRFLNVSAHDWVREGEGGGRREGGREGGLTRNDIGKYFSKLRGLGFLLYRHYRVTILKPKP
jgi:hypothetical protein